MWTKERWNAVDVGKPIQRTVGITLDEYRELVRENAERNMTVRKKDELIYKLRRKVEKMTNVMSEVDRDGSDDGE